jgi:uncharacterized protein (DUF1499 family)
MLLRRACGEGRERLMAGGQKDVRISKAIARMMASLALAVAVLGGLALLVSGPGYRLGWWTLSSAYDLLSYGLLAGLAAVSLGVIALLASWQVGSVRGRNVALIGVIVALVAAYVPLYWRTLALEAPPIHDISTDLDHPPAFHALAGQRLPEENETAYGGEAVARLQEEAYPDIAPLLSDKMPDDVFTAVMEVLGDTNWDIAAIDTHGRVIEATEETFWFGFKDDVVITVAARSGGSRVDMRSQSRVGVADAGTNARRVEQFLDAVRHQLES